MHFDFLIIGQGISGTFLSWYLEKQGASFLVIDDNDKHAPSKIAAGVINPVTGRRMVTVWMAADVIPFARQAYLDIGSELGITAISQKNIIDFFPNPFMRENFLKRLAEGNEYIREAKAADTFPQYFNYDFGCGEIEPVYMAHVETLLPAWRRHLQMNNRLQEEKFDIGALSITSNSVSYKDIMTDIVIFCNGAGGFENPYFKLLPFAPSKGEALIVEVPGLPHSHIYKRSMLLAPLQSGADLFWVGSNYAWSFDNADPTSTFREATEKLLDSWLKIPYRVLEHLAGVRPATIERRPFVGMHPAYPRIGILNGLGTKGCSLAPYFSNALVDHLLHDKPIATEASIGRFERMLKK
ncbi:MAG: FAD-binding oxidoreductase [Chitinophagaceae bacterium]|nr:FAD-binding oxidoreductase [Chitinophagaceae bacterium]